MRPVSLGSSLVARPLLPKVKTYSAKGYHQDRRRVQNYHRWKGRAPAAPAPWPWHQDQDQPRPGPKSLLELEDEDHGERGCKRTYSANWGSICAKVMLGSGVPSSSLNHIRLMDSISILGHLSGSYRFLPGQSYTSLSAHPHSILHPHRKESRDNEAPVVVRTAMGEFHNKSVFVLKSYGSTLLKDGLVTR